MPNNMVRIPLALYIIFFITLGIAAIAVLAYIVTLVCKTLRKNSQPSQVNAENGVACVSLGETLKQLRIDCNMTQEYVAEAMNVSRQAVSKWETGTSDPSTANLLSLAKLYGVSAEELLKIDNQETPLVEPIPQEEKAKSKPAKLKDFLRFLWNFLVMVVFIGLSIFYISTVGGYKPDFLVGYFTADIMAYIFYLTLVSCWLLMGAFALNVINIFIGNFALEDKKAFVMKCLHCGTVILCIIAIFITAVFPNPTATGAKLFHTFLLIASLREVVYQAMLFVDNGKRESMSKVNKVCFICSSIGVFVLVIFSIYSISLSVDSAYIFNNCYPYDESENFHAIGNRGWLIFSAIALSIITFLFIVSLLKEIKKNKEKEQSE